MRPKSFSLNSFLSPLEEGSQGFEHKVMDSQVTQDLDSAAPSYDAVDPLEFFPFISGSTRAALHSQTKFQPILDLLAVDGVYLKETKWNFKQMRVLDGQGHDVPDPSPEQQTAALFNQVLQTAVWVNPDWDPTWSLYTWRSHAESMVLGAKKPRRKLDVVLVKKGLQHNCAVSFSDIVTYCELKQHSRSSTIREAWLQIAEIAGLVVGSQVHRRFFIGLSLCGAELRLVLYARGAVVSSRPFNINEEPLRFVEVLLNLSFVDSVCHGFDENFIDLGQGNEFALRIANLRVSVTSVKLFHSLSIKGRGTKVSLCSRRNSESPGKSYYVLKDCWLPEGTTDIEIYNHLTSQPPAPFANDKQASIFGEQDECNIFRGCSQIEDVWDPTVNLPGIPIIAASEIPKCRNPCASQPEGASSSEQRHADTTQHVLSRFSTKLSYEPRTHVRVLSETCGTSLVWFSCRREFLNGLMCAIAGHFNGLRKDVLHCDVSDTNVWFIVSDLDVDKVVPDWPKDGTYTKRAGVLGDWGLAEIRSPSQQNDNLAGTVTGTYPFLASELLSGPGLNGEVCHEVHHDLESFFWLLWITCVNLNGPYLHRRLWDSTHSNDRGTSQHLSTQSTFSHHHPRLSSTAHLRYPRDAPDEDNSTVPAWATPGLHSCTTDEVYEFKQEISVVRLVRSLSPYFSVEPIIKGLKRLREHFVWTLGKQGKDLTPPKERITHQIFIEILQQMRDEIPHNDDCPTEQDIARGRRSYQKLVDSGRGFDVPVMQEANPVPSQSRSTSKGATVTNRSRGKSSRKATEDPSQDIPVPNQHSSSRAKRRRT